MMDYLSQKKSQLSMDYNKCGYIYKSSIRREKDALLLSCLECCEVFSQLESFLHHTFNHLSLDENVVIEEDCSVIGSSVLTKKYNSQCSISETLIGDDFFTTNEDRFGNDPLEEIVLDNQVTTNTNLQNLDYPKYKPATINDVFIAENNRNDDTEFEQDAEGCNEENYTNEDYGSDSQDENKKDSIKSNNKSIRHYMTNRPFISAVIEAYKKQKKLWDTMSGCESNSIRYQSLKAIAHEINKKFNVNTTANKMNLVIKRLRNLFGQYQPRSDVGQYQCKQKLWFYEELKFIEPHTKFRRKSNLCDNLNDSQISLLIKLLKDNECLWNEENIYHTSATYKQASLMEYCNNFVKNYKQYKFTVNDMIKIIDELKDIVVNEKKELIKQTDKKTKPKHRLYSDLKFLAPHVGPFHCCHCDKIVMDIYDYKYHVSKHEGTKAFKCMVCHKELSHKKSFMCHLQRHTQECPFQCNLCEKSFPSRKEQQRHIIKHGSKPYVCEICANTFYTQHQLTNHIKTHANIRDHVCPQCGKGFTHRGLLRQHLNTHNNTNCPCSLCDNVYANPRSLKRHYVRVHQSSQDTNTFSQYCKICKVSFSSTLEARCHRKEHKQSLPVKRKHVCDICGLDFAYPRNLADHKKTHFKERNEVCDVCGKAFTNVNILNQHKEVHIAEKSICRLCGKEYAHYRGLCRHMNKVHMSRVRDIKDDKTTETTKSNK